LVIKPCGQQKINRFKYELIASQNEISSLDNPGTPSNTQMRTRLPSMTSLLSFEAAARTLSFTKAAHELHLTQTAISHQIKNLESLLNHKLFTRQSNNLALTKAGAEYLTIAREAILNLSTATERLADQNNKDVLTIECLGMFAIKQLLPRLHEFQKMHPEIKLRIKTMQILQSSLMHHFDVAIWHGNGNWIGLDAESLGKEEVFPVCSPELLAGNSSLINPSDLSKFTVIRTISPVVNDEWANWMSFAQEAPIEFQSAINCDYLVTSLHAAIAGLGVALGRSTVVEDDLIKGNLVEPLSIRAPSLNNYYLVSPKGAAETKKTQAFKSWLKESIGVSARSHTGVSTASF
jgi:LysR family glycine cleavage system transcriptional activator